MQLLKNNPELHRKALHCASIIFPIIYLFSSKLYMVIILMLSTGLVLSMDISRHYNKLIQGIVDKFFKSIMRPEELSGTTKLTGASYMFLGLFISCVLFSRGLAIACFLVLIVSDTLAAIVGKKYNISPKHNKSLEGTGAFFMSALLIGILSYTIVPYETNFFGIILAAIVATLVEYYSKDIGVNDNLIIPVSYGLSISFISVFV